MAHLTSCYFCSTALDSPLQSYELPGGGETTTVSLCPPCEEKLETVLDAVGVDQPQPSSSESAVEPQAEEDNTIHGDTSIDEDTSMDKGTSTDEDAPMDKDTSRDERTPAERDVATDEKGRLGETVIDDGDIIVADEEVDVDDGVEEVDVEEGDVTADAGGSETDENADDSDEDASDSPFSGRELLPDDDPLASDSESSTDGEVDSDSDTERSEPAETDAEEAEVGETSTETADVDASDGNDTERTITARDYNKVIRLLRNREFPVDREEFETIASSAYNLRPSQCAQVLDLAIDKDLLEERDGMLYRP